MTSYDIVIVGGGPAGLAAAVSAKNNGIDRILILERDRELGGILNQCIHNGFGLHTFKEELTGPEYARRFINQALDLNIEYRLNTMVMDISLAEGSSDKIVTAMNRTDGLFHINAKTVILAMGCRERSRGALNIPGYRPAGIYSAGTAQRLVNIEGFMPGRKVVILGSGDIGRNIVQCLDDFGIPLKLSHTVVDIRGKERVEGITLAQVDEHNKPIPGTEEDYECDTLLLSCGLIPENEISRSMGVELNPVTSGPSVNESLETNIPGVFACGNVLHVHDLVDYVSEEAGVAGKNAAKYIKCGGDHADSGKEIPIVATDGVRYTVPKTLHVANMDDELTVRFRVGGVYKNCYISTYLNDQRIICRKRPVMAPGEMEQVKLQKSVLEAMSDLDHITIKIEEEA